MLVLEARAQASEWVERKASRTAGFLGAFLTGSTKWKPADALHRASSDVDVRVVVDTEQAPADHKKSFYRDILLEAAFVTRASLGSAETILLDPYLAGSLWYPVLLADPTGVLHELGEGVTREFARRPRVVHRSNGLREIALSRLDHIDAAETFPEQVTSWLFGTGVTTMVLLAAGLRNLTVRRRYADSRALLAEHGRLDFHEEMLTWIGCEDMSQERVRRHLRALGAAYDATAEHLDSSFRFAADLRPAARLIAIDGTREMIDEGLHREAVFWLVSTFSRCLQGLVRDAPRAVRDLCEDGFRDLLRDLDIETRGDLVRHAGHVRSWVPQLESVAADIIDGTPEITD
jgi:hypothetical protein